MVNDLAAIISNTKSQLRNIKRKNQNEIHKSRPKKIRLDNRLESPIEFIPLQSIVQS